MFDKEKFLARRTAPRAIANERAVLRRIDERFALAVDPWSMMDDQERDDLCDEFKAAFMYDMYRQALHRLNDHEYVAAMHAALQESKVSA